MPRRPPLRAVLLAAVSLVFALSPPATAGGEAPLQPPLPTGTSTQAGLAVVELVIHTTSDWTTVALDPGRFVATRVVDNPAGTTVTTGEAGLTVAGAPAEGALVVARAVYEERSGRRVQVLLDKGADGEASVTLRNVSGVPTDVATLRSERHGTDNRTTASIARGRVFGSRDAVLPKADPRRLVLAFYYPWFSGDDYGEHTLADRPSSPSADTDDPADVLAMTQEARANGIDGFVVSWQGEEDGAAFDHVLDAAAATGGTASAYLETALANPAGRFNAPADRAIVKQWLREALARSSHPAFLHSGGVPVILVYRMWLLPAPEWEAINAELAAEGTPVRLVGNDPQPRLGAALWGSHRYGVHGASEWTLHQWAEARAADLRAEAALDPAKAPRLFAATVSPGYDDRRLRGPLRPTEPRGLHGERYDATWRAALAADPDWILVTSWNEWYEGTSVQPGRRNGDLALRQTALWSARFGAA